MWKQQVQVLSSSFDQREGCCTNMQRVSSVDWLLDETILTTAENYSTGIITRSWTIRWKRDSRHWGLKWKGSKQHLCDSIVSVWIQKPIAANVSYLKSGWHLTNGIDHLYFRGNQLKVNTRIGGHLLFAGSGRHWSWFSAFKRQSNVTRLR